MGLDMYLHAEMYVSQRDYTTWVKDSGEEPPVNEAYKTVTSLFPTGSDEYNSESGALVSLTIGYWRKANAIHGWIVKKCAYGVDECQRIYVNHIRVKELRDLVSILLINKDPVEAQAMLSPEQGFFFGSDEIDDWYWENLEKTIHILDKAIDLQENQGMSIYYQASW